MKSQISQGFIYVMINPSMPGLAKVGKTTRTSEERGIELSSATGGPSPFIIVYEHPVEDCHAAEAWIHTELERRGYRASNNREFFTAPIHEIVSVVAMGSNVKSTLNQQTNINSNPPTEDIDQKRMAEDLSLLADKFLEGSGDIVRNPSNALKLYEQAGILGDAYACEKAADLLINGCDGIRKNPASAIDYLKRSIAANPKHNWACNGKIGKIYSELNQPESAMPYWHKLIENINNQTNHFIIAPLWRYCFDVANNNLPSDINESKIGILGSSLIDEVNMALSSQLIDRSSAERTKAFIVDCVGKSWS